MRERASWVLVPTIVAVVSRIFSAILVAIQVAPATPQVTSDGSPFLAYDAGWYVGLAQAGYHALPVQSGPANIAHYDFAFLPGWPLLIRVASIGGALPMDATAVVLANALFVLAAIAAYALFRERFSRQTALWGTFLLAFNPVSYVFSIAYGEALFVLLVGLYFLDHYGRWSPILAGLSVLVRVTGLAVGASAGAMFVLNRAPRRRLALICVAVGLVFAGWWIYLWYLTGRFDAWLLGSASWSTYLGIAAILREVQVHPLRSLLWDGFVAIMIIGNLLILRRHPDMAVYGLTAILMAVVAGSPSSLPRYAMVAFPAYAALADRIGSRLSAVLLAAFVVGQVSFIGYAFGPLPEAP